MYATTPKLHMSIEQLYGLWSKISGAEKIK